MFTGPEVGWSHTNLLDVVRAIERGGVRRLVPVPLRDALRPLTIRSKSFCSPSPGGSVQTSVTLSDVAPTGTVTVTLCSCAGVEGAALVLDDQLLVGTERPHNRGDVHAAETLVHIRNRAGLTRDVLPSDAARTVDEHRP